MYLLLMICLAVIGVLLLVAAAKCRKKSGTAAGILGIAGAFLIVAVSKKNQEVMFELICRVCYHDWEDQIIQKGMVEKLWE